MRRKSSALPRPSPYFVVPRMKEKVLYGVLKRRIHSLPDLHWARYLYIWKTITPRLLKPVRNYIKDDIEISDVTIHLALIFTLLLWRKQEVGVLFQTKWWSSFKILILYCELDCICLDLGLTYGTYPRFRILRVWRWMYDDLMTLVMFNIFKRIIVFI